MLHEQENCIAKYILEVLDKTRVNSFFTTGILRDFNVLVCHTDLQGERLGRYLYKCLPNGFDHMMVFHDHVRD